MTALNPRFGLQDMKPDIDFCAEWVPLEKDLTNAFTHTVCVCECDACDGCDECDKCDECDDLNHKQCVQKVRLQDLSTWIDTQKKLEDEREVKRCSRHGVPSSSPQTTCSVYEINVATFLTIGVPYY